MSASRTMGRVMGRAPIGAVLLWLLAAAGGLALVIGSFVTAVPGEGGPWAPFVVFLMLAVDAQICTTVGVLIVTRRSDNLVGWLLAAIGVGLVWTFAGFALSVSRTAQAGPNDPLGGLFGWIGLVAFNPTLALVGLIAVVFPDGRFPSARWKLPVGAVLVALFGATLIIAIAPGAPDPTLAANPFGVDHPVVRAIVPFALIMASLGSFGCILLGVVAVVSRFLRARGDTRQQLKWFMGAFAMVALTTIPTTAFGSGELGLLDIAGAASLGCEPNALGAAILRYHLYDIDRLISRTVGWAVVTVILVVIFGTGVVAIQVVLAAVTQGKTLAVAASTLAAFVLFQPIRRRVQTAVDRRFDRASYDAARVVEGFSGRLDDQLGLATLSDEIVRVSIETVCPVSAAIWLRPVWPQQDRDRA
jgi:hypothetical protein